MQFPFQETWMSIYISQKKNKKGKFILGVIAPNATKIFARVVRFIDKT